MILIYGLYNKQSKIMRIKSRVNFICVFLIFIAVPINANTFNGFVYGNAEFSSHLLQLGVNAENFAEFLKFKATFGRAYENEAEELASLLAFVKNLELINLHKEKFLKGESKFEQGITNLTDIGHVLFMSSHTGYIAKAKARSFVDFEYPSVELPEYLNYVDQGLVTRVAYQGYCGACWSFSTTGALEAQLAKKTGKLVKLSEQNLIDCNKDEDNGNWGCKGGNMQIAFNHIKTSGGINTFNSYSYRGRGNYSCKYDLSKSVGTIEDFVELQSRNETELQLALYHVGPISLAIDASVPSFQNYKSGIYDDPQCSHELNHAVLLIGYGTDPKGGPYWILKNSWGKKWGENGFFRLPRNQGDFCGISLDASYPIV